MGGTNGGGFTAEPDLGGVRDPWIIEADVPAGWCDKEVFGGGWTEVDGGGFSKCVGCESR